MYQVIYQEENKLEIRLTEGFDDVELKEVLHQLESMCTAHPKINVLLDAIDLDSFNVKMLIKDMDFYKNYRNHLNRVAVVSNNVTQNLFVKMFNPFSEAELKSFSEASIEDARKWIFPSKLP